jgi:hypothetical protein
MTWLAGLCAGLSSTCSSLALALERIHFVEVVQDTLARMERSRPVYLTTELQVGYRLSELEIP